MKPEECLPHEVPIRGMTKALLTREPEKDFILSKFLILVVTCISLVWALYIQIYNISYVCCSGYICPFESSTSGLPIVAPPVAFRNPTATAFIDTTTNYLSVKLAQEAIVSRKSFWMPEVKMACEFDSKDCSTPGYQVQWPYMQSEISPTECGSGQTYDTCPDGDWRNCKTGIPGICSVLNPVIVILVIPFHSQLTRVSFRLDPILLIPTSSFLTGR